MPWLQPSRAPSLPLRCRIYLVERSKFFDQALAEAQAAAAAAAEALAAAQAAAAAAAAALAEGLYNFP